MSRLAAAYRLARLVLVDGLRWMVGMLAGLRVHRHVVDTGGLRVRNGFTVDVLVPREEIGERAVRALSVGVGSQTNVDVVPREPRVLPVRRTAGEAVAELRICADDARGLVARLRQGPEHSHPADAGERAR